MNLSPGLSEAAVEMLVKNILKSHFPQECKAWEDQQTEFQKDNKEALKAKIAEMKASMPAEFPHIQDTLMHTISESVIERFPYDLCFHTSYVPLIPYLECSRMKASTCPCRRTTTTEVICSDILSSH